MRLLFFKTKTALAQQPAGHVYVCTCAQVRGGGSEDRGALAGPGRTTETKRSCAARPVYISSLKCSKLCQYMPIMLALFLNAYAYLKLKLCRHNLPEPIDCCGQHFCSSCLEQVSISSYNRQCPHCRKNYQSMLNQSLKREINELKIYCVNRSRKHCFSRN